MDAYQASVKLTKSIENPKAKLSLADCVTQSGLSFYEAERGLLALVSEYRGELTPTDKGDLLYNFPTGFRKPWEKKEAFEVFLDKIKKTTLGIAKFVVRSWITVVMIGYVAIFAAILIGLTFAKSNDREDRGGSSFGQFMMFEVLFRLILNSLFWTFHPFSPLRVRRHDNVKSAAFYEKVNRFFFGPEEVEKDPLEHKKLVLAEIRAKKGRIALLDVLKVTGLTKEQADPLLAKLMLDYDGQIKVSDFGGITYSFPDLRKTADTHTSQSYFSSTSNVSRPSWLKRKILAPLTGNSSGSNLLIAGLNGFNLLMSTVAIQNFWSLSNLKLMFMGVFMGVPPEALILGDSALILGWVPFWFSAVLFSLPLMRWLARPRQRAEINQDNGRRGVLWAVLNQLNPWGIKEPVLEHAWEQAAGVKASQREITREVIKLGGELELNDSTGETQYRFHSLEAEVSALHQERSEAKHSERSVGQEVWVG